MHWGERSDNRYEGNGGGWVSQAVYEAAMIAATCAVIIPGSFLFGVFVEWLKNSESDGPKQ